MAVHLVVGGRWHDFDYARARLIEALARRGVTAVSRDAWPGRLGSGDVLVTYTCDLRPDDRAQRLLVDFVDGGGRWLALHGSNAAIEPPEPGADRVFTTPDVLGRVPEVLGSRFLGHPPMAPYQVEVADPSHPLVAGIDAFETRDELYVSELYPPLQVLLHARFSGACPSFADGDTVDDEPRPVLYLRAFGQGEVTYLTLGHCRTLAELHELGKDDATEPDHGSWELPEFRTLLERCLDRVLG